MRIVIDTATIRDLPETVEQIKATLAATGDMVQAVGDFIEAQTAALPDELKPKGQAIETAWRELIAKGVDPEQAQQFLDTPYGELLQMQALIKAMGPDKTLANLSDQEVHTLEVLLSHKVEFAGLFGSQGYIGITVNAVEQKVGGFILDKMLKITASSSTFLRENSEAVSAVMGILDLPAAAGWALAAMGNGAGEVVLPRTASTQASRDAIQYWVNEFEAGAVTVDQLRIEVGAQVDAIQSNVMADFRDAVADANLTPEQAALYGTAAIATLTGSAFLLRRLTPSGGNPTDDMLHLADNLDEVRGSVVSLQAHSNLTYRSKLILGYAQEVQDITGFKIPANQRELLATSLRETNYSRTLTKSEADIHRLKFKGIKDDLVAQWEASTSQSWPTYTEPVWSKDGTKIIRNVGEPWDTHHLIENNRAGPHEWWNIHPAKFPDQHQGGIHGSDSALKVLEEFLKNSRG